MGTEINLIPKQTFDASAIISGIIADARLQTWVIRKAAPQSVTNSIVLVNDNHFQWAMKNGNIYHFRLALYISSPAAAGGFRFKLVVPGSGSAWGFCHDDIGILAAANTLQETDFTVNKVYPILSATSAFIVVEGVIQAQADGTVVFQWAQGTANENGTVLEAYSYAILHRMGV